MSVYWTNFVIYSPNFVLLPNSSKSFVISSPTQSYSQLLKILCNLLPNYSRILPTKRGARVEPSQVAVAYTHI